MQQNILSGLIFVVEGDGQKFVRDKNFPIYGISISGSIILHSFVEDFQSYMDNYIELVFLIEKVSAPCQLQDLQHPC